ncbi:hypothetical protein FB639_000469, partial [Coemansia asiatica]
MSRQGARLPEFYRGANSRDDQAPRNSAASSSSSTGASGRGRGRGALAKKIVFQPSVRALPLCTHTATQAAESRDKKSHSNHSGLLLINKKPSYAAADSNNSLGQSLLENHVHADNSDASTKSATATNPWAARIRPRANTAECISVSNSDAGAQGAILASKPVGVESSFLPLTDSQTAETPFQRWDDMLDSGTELADGIEPDDRNHLPNQLESAPQRDALIVPDIDAATRGQPALVSEPESVPESKPESASSEPNAKTTHESESERPACAETEASAPLPVPATSKTADIWGKPQKEVSAPVQHSQSQASRWWKASLSKGSASQPSAAPSLSVPGPTLSSDSQARRPTSLKLSTMQKTESDLSRKLRTAKTLSESADAKGKRSFGRRQTAPIPTVVPPVILSKAMARPKDYLSPGSTGPASSVIKRRPLSASGDGNPVSAAAAPANLEPDSLDLKQVNAEAQKLESPIQPLDASTGTNALSNDPTLLASLRQDDSIAAKPERGSRSRGDLKPFLAAEPAATSAVPRVPAQRKPGGSNNRNNSSSNFSNVITHADNWRSGSRPRLQQQQQQQQTPNQTQTQTNSQERIDSVGSWRRSANASKDTTNHLSLIDKPDRPNSKSLSTDNWRAAVPNSLKQKPFEDTDTAVASTTVATAAAVSAFVVATSTASSAIASASASASSRTEPLPVVKPATYSPPPLLIAEPQFVSEKPSSVRSQTVADDLQDSSRILRVDRQRSQTQSVGSTLTKDNHSFYCGSVGPGLLSASDTDRGQLKDLLQIKPPVSSTSSATAKPTSSSTTASINIKSDNRNSNSVDNDSTISMSDSAAIPPLLSRKILADILGGDEVPIRNNTRSSSDVNANASHPVKPIGGGSIKAASADKAPAKSTSGSRHENGGDALGRNKLGYSSSSLFQIADNSLLASAYSVAGRPALEGAYSVDQSPSFWQQQQINVGIHDAHSRYRYIYQQNGFTQSAPSSKASIGHDQAHKDSAAPPYNAFSATSVDQQWMYSPAIIPPQMQQVSYAQQPYAEGASAFALSSGPPGPAPSTFSSGTAMIWSDSGQALVDAPLGVQTFRNPADSSRTASHGDSNNQHGYKDSGKQPRPIGTRSTPASGQHHNMRSWQEENTSQHQRHHQQHHQQQQQQRFLTPNHSQHMHLQSWLPQYSGVQPQLYMHGPTAGYGVPSPHQSPQVTAIPANAGASVVSPYIVPHHHFMVMQPSAPGIDAVSGAASSVPRPINGVHAIAANGNGAVADNENHLSPSSFAGAAPLHYASKPAQQAYSKHPAYAYPTGSSPAGQQQHHYQQQQQQQEQLGFIQYAQPLYAEPSPIAYSPMYIGQPGSSSVQGLSSAPNYYLYNELQQMPIAVNQQQQQQQQSSLSLSATPFQPGAFSKQQQQQQQQQYQPSRQRGRSRGLELIEQSDRTQAIAENKDSEDRVPEKDHQTEDSQKPENVSATATKSVKEKAAKSSNGSSNASQNTASTKECRGDQQRSGRSQDRKNTKQSTKAATDTVLPPQTATTSDSAMQHKGCESKRRQRPERNRKPVKSAASAASAATTSDLLPESLLAPVESTETSATRSVEKTQKSARGGNRSSRGIRRSQAS